MLGGIESVFWRCSVAVLEAGLCYRWANALESRGFSRVTMLCILSGADNMLAWVHISKSYTGWLIPIVIPFLSFIWKKKKKRACSQSILGLYAWLFLDVTWLANPNTSCMQYNGNNKVFGKSHQASHADFFLRCWSLTPCDGRASPPAQKGTLRGTGVSWGLVCSSVVWSGCNI